LKPELTSETESWRRLEQLQDELSTRASVLHFAHAAVSLVATLMLGGAGFKMLKDLAGEELSFAYGVLGIAGALLTYALIRTAYGFIAKRREQQRFTVLQSLRRQLRLDDPSALLPLR
jgi:hypothetical protein